MKTTEIRFAKEINGVVIYTTSDLLQFEGGTPFYELRILPSKGMTLKDFKLFLDKLNSNMFDNPLITGIGFSEKTNVEIKPFVYSRRSLVFSDELLEFNGKEFIINKDKLIRSMLNTGWEII